MQHHSAYRIRCHQNPECCYTVMELDQTRLDSGILLPRPANRLRDS